MPPRHHAQDHLSTEQPGPRGHVLHPAFLLTCLFSSLPQNCSVAVCQRIQCAVPSFGIQEEFKVTLKSNLSFDWYIQVCGGLRLGWAQVMILQGPRVQLHPVSLPQTSHNHLQVVSKAEILFDESEFTLLPGQDGFVMAQVCVWDTERSLEAGEESGLAGGREAWAGGVGTESGGDRGQGGVNHGVQGPPRNLESFSLMYPLPLPAPDRDQGGVLRST